MFIRSKPQKNSQGQKALLYDKRKIRRVFPYANYSNYFLASNVCSEESNIKKEMKLQGEEIKQEDEDICSKHEDEEDVEEEEEDDNIDMDDICARKQRQNEPLQSECAEVIKYFQSPKPYNF